MKNEHYRYDQLLRKKNLHLEKWRSSADIAKNERLQEKRDFVQATDAEIARLMAKKRKIMSEMKKDEQDFEQLAALLERDADDEIEEETSKFDQKLKKEKADTLSLKDRNAILKRKFGALKDEIMEKVDLLQQHTGKQQRLYAEITSLEKDITSHLKEIKERDSTIDDKTARISDLRKKNQELEQFKCVLVYKITELKRKIRPREQVRQQKCEQISQMEKELKEYEIKAAKDILSLKQLQLRSNGMEKEITLRVEDRVAVDSRLRKFKAELSEVYSIEEPKALKNAVVQLYQRHVTSQLHTKAQRAADDHKDYHRQRKYLEHSVDSLNDKLEKDMHVHKKENVRIMQENIALISEINELRREIQILRTTQRLKEDAKQQARHAELLRRKRFQANQSQKRNALEREIEEQLEQIRALNHQLRVLNQRIEDEQAAKRNVVASAATVRRLPAVVMRTGGGTQQQQHQQEFKQQHI
jgi:hypothetical protein